MKKFAFYFVVMLVLLSSISFAAPTKEEAAKAISVSAPGAFPIVEERVSLRFMWVKTAGISDIATNLLTQYMEEMTNVRILWDTVQGNEAVRISLASGDLPDAIWGNASITTAEEQKFASEGIFVPLDSLIEKHAVNTMKVFREFPALQDALTLPDGHIYHLPNAALDNHSFLGNKAWIYKPWLDDLGRGVPTTTEELYQVLKAFKEQDLNGNNKADEIPMSGAANTWNARPDDFLMNAFVLNNKGGQFVVRNHTITFAPAMPEWREGLRYINKLYSEGLIDSGAYTQDLGRMQQLAENRDVPILGSFAGGHLAMGWSLDPQGRSNDAVPLLPLKGPAGVQVTPFGRGGSRMAVDGPNGYPLAIVMWPAFFVTSAAEYPEIAVKYADYFFSEEGYMWSHAGEKDVHWREAKPGELGWAEQPAAWAPLEQEQSQLMGSGIQNIHWNANNPGWNSIRTRLGKAAPDPNDYNLYLGKVTRDYAPYISNQDLPLLPYIDPAYADEMAQLSTLITSFADESTVRFITGDRDLAEWDSYLRDLERLGLKRFLQIYQESYDKKYR